jgi:ankyrin repeat protein
VEELAQRGVDFLPTAKSRDVICNLAVLIRCGFTSLVDRIGVLVAELKLKSGGDWHAFGDKSRPGLWFARRDISDPTNGFHNPEPLLQIAATRNLPNMEMITLLVEKFGVDINEIHFTERYMEGGYRAVPESSTLHQLSRGHAWWHIRYAIPYLLQAGADLHSRNYLDQTPLHLALRGDGNYPGPFNKEAAKLLIEAGADVNAVDRKGESCLAYAKHHADMIRLPIAHRATVTPDAIFAAIESRNSDALSALLSGGVDPNMRRDRPPKDLIKDKKANRNINGALAYELKPHEQFPVYLAARTTSPPWNKTSKSLKYQQDRIQLVQVMLDHGADPFTKFLKAIPSHEIDKKSKLIYKPTTKVPEGFLEHTVLHDLMDQGMVVDNFLDMSGLDVNHSDSGGRTLLHVACAGGLGPDHIIGSHMENTDENLKVSYFERLNSLGATLESIGYSGRNVLHHIIGLDRDVEFQRAQTAFEKVLVQAPCLINQGDNNGMTPLHYAVSRAARKRNTKIADLLLSAGADPLAIDKNGDNMLHLLACNLDILALWNLFIGFAERGVDVNARNNRGETPLFAYCQRPKKNDSYLFQKFGRSRNEEYTEIEATPLFKTLGADFFAKDNSGRGLLHAATSGDVGRFKELLALGLDPMLEDDAQRTAIDVAAASGNQDVFELFEKRTNSLRVQIRTAVTEYEIDSKLVLYYSS